MQYSINPEQMNRVLRQLRINIRWEELMDRYVNYRPRHSAEMFTNITLDDLAFTSVFCFTKTSIVPLRRQLAGFVRNFQQFHGDTLDDAMMRMHLTSNYYNNVNARRVPFVNWLPQFGGMVQQLHGNPQIAYMLQHGIPFWLTGAIPQSNTINHKYLVSIVVSHS